MKGKILKKIIASTLVMTILSCASPIPQVSDIFGDAGFSASAATYSSNNTVNYTNCNVGDIFEVGAGLRNNTNNIISLNGLNDEIAVGETYVFTERCKLTGKGTNSLTFSVVGLETTNIITKPDYKTYAIYDGTDHNVIKSGASVSGGQTVYYGLSTSSNTQPSSWYTDINSVKISSIGNYYLWIKTNGNGSYKPLSPTKMDTFIMCSDSWSLLEGRYFDNYSGTQSTPFVISDAGGLGVPLRCNGTR